MRLNVQRCVVLLLVGAVTLPVQAQRLSLPELRSEAPTMQLMQKPERTERQRIISPEEAVRRARKEYPGKVLDVRLRGQGSFYAVKIIKKGKVRVVRVPAEK